MNIAYDYRLADYDRKVIVCAKAKSYRGSMMNRRSFLKRLGGAAGLVAVPWLAKANTANRSSTTLRTVNDASKRTNHLFAGGTGRYNGIAINERAMKAWSKAIYDEASRPSVMASLMGKL